MTIPLVEIALTQSLQLSTLDETRLELERILSLHPHHLVIDLTACPSVDAAGIGLLLDVHRRMWSENGLLSLRSPAPRLRRILHLARVDNVLRITTDDDPAPQLPPPAAPAPHDSDADRGAMRPRPDSRAVQ